MVGNSEANVSWRKIAMALIDGILSASPVINNHAQNVSQNINKRVA
jgi:hypothetical protein